MNPKRALATVVSAIALLAAGASPAGAVSDYPPSGPVILVTGDLIAGGSAEAAVENCTVGEVVRTTLATMPTVESMCEPTASSSTSGDAPARGVARFELPLPLDSGVAAGEASLLDSGHTLSFALDVRADEVADVATDPVSSGRSGWPFLLLAALIVLVFMIIASRRRTSDDTP